MTDIRDGLMPGQIVRLRAYGDAVISRVLVREENGFLLVTTEEEYRAAEREKREPILVGFPAEDAVREA